MAATKHAYSPNPTRNPFRYALAVWRLVRGDPSENTAEAAIVEIGFARSRLGRRFARWETMIAHLKRDPSVAKCFEERRLFGPVDLSELDGLPDGTLGRTFAEHCRSREINPNLIDVPPNDEVGWTLNHLYSTHDVWHVLTGWDTDLRGEVGLASFYCAQFGSPPFFGYMLALILLNVISRRADLDEVWAALSDGYRAGRTAEPLFGTAWEELWDAPIEDVRKRFGIAAE